MDSLSTNFTIILISVLVVNTMMGMIFKGEADTAIKYIISVGMAAGAAITFGVISADIVTIIVEMSSNA